MIQVPNDKAGQVLSFVRQTDGNKVFAAFNFSPEPQEVTFAQTLYQGAYTEFDSGDDVELDGGATLSLPAWGYRVFSSAD
jgi:hypothetical protein